jgi:hypothetical protein
LPSPTSGPRKERSLISHRVSKNSIVHPPWQFFFHQDGGELKRIAILWFDSLFLLLRRWQYCCSLLSCRGFLLVGPCKSRWSTRSI